MSARKYLSFLFLCTMFCYHANAQQLVVELIANAGVKISSGNKVVLIDALFGPHERFNYLNENAFKDMVNLDVAAVMTSHHHDDHFGDKRALQYLQANTNTMFVAPPQVLDYIVKRTEHSLLKAPKLKDFQSVSYAHRGVNITVLNFPHMSPELTADVQNYAYIVEINGWRVLHIGDGGISPEIINGLKLADEGIDLSLLHDLCPEQDDCVQRIQQIGAKQVAFYHMTDERVEPVGAWIKQNYPNAQMLVTGQKPIVLLPR